MYRFHPGVRDACKQKIFHPEAKSHRGENFTPGLNNACKLPLMQFWKTAYTFVFTSKQYAEDFKLYHLLLLEECAR